MIQPPVYSTSSTSSCSQNDDNQRLVSDSTSTSTSSSSSSTSSSSHHSTIEPFILNLTPLSTKSSFITGHLSLDDHSALIEGEVQFKFTNSSIDRSTYSFCRLSVHFRAIETSLHSTQQTPIELVHQQIVLWENAQFENLSLHASSSFSSKSNPSTPKSDAQIPPGLLPFQFPLTSDLPHCIHLPNGHGLSYQLEVCLAYRHQAPIDQSIDRNHLNHSRLLIPIHISRYSKHGQHPSPPLAPLPSIPTSDRLPFSLSPVEIRSYHPTPILISLSQTLLRHSEPLALQIRIPPPAQQLIQEKGLQLRSVRAQLRRHIRERCSSSDTPHHIATTVLATSGKSCRFSSSRAVFLRLTLHSCLARPTTSQNAGLLSLDHELIDHRPSPIETISRCETITQSTILYDVYFTLLVVVSIVGRDGERQDLEIERDIGIVPDWPPTQDGSSIASGKAREAAEEEPHEEEFFIAAADFNGPAPTYFETDNRADFQGSVAKASTSQLAGLDFQRIGPLDWQADDDEEEEEEEEEEYDGYESFSLLAGHDGPAPPTIDEDESPPPAPHTPPEGIELQAPLIVHADQLGFELYTQSSLTSNPIGFMAACGDPPAQYSSPRSTHESPSELPNETNVHQLGYACEGQLGIGSRRDSTQDLDRSRELEGRLLDEEVGRPPAYAAGWIDQAQDHHRDSSAHLEEDHQRFLEAAQLEPAHLDIDHHSSVFLNLARTLTRRNVLPTPDLLGSSARILSQHPNPDSIILSESSVEPPPYAADFS